MVLWKSKGLSLLYKTEILCILGMEAAPQCQPGPVIPRHLYLGLIIISLQSCFEIKDNHVCKVINAWPHSHLINSTYFKRTD